jgi:hypothetical protein
MRDVFSSGIPPIEECDLKCVKDLSPSSHVSFHSEIAACGPSYNKLKGISAPAVHAGTSHVGGATAAALILRFMIENSRKEASGKIPQVASISVLEISFYPADGFGERGLSFVNIASDLNFALRCVHNGDGGRRVLGFLRSCLAS